VVTVHQQVVQYRFIYGIKGISKTMKRTKISNVHGQPIPNVDNSFTKEMRSDRAYVWVIEYWTFLVIRNKQKQ